MKMEDVSEKQVYNHWKCKCDWHHCLTCGFVFKVGSDFWIQIQVKV